MSLLQYLSHYAEPESGCKYPHSRYSNVVIIPAFDEVPSMLDGYRNAVAQAEKVLWIIVVNNQKDADPGAILRTRYLLQALSAGSTPLSQPGVSIAMHSIGDLVIVDRCSEGRELPPKQGVGLARKIGCDLALAWQEAGRIASPWLHCTDADVELPEDYFVASDKLVDDASVVALSYPFWHMTEAASASGRALSLYELSLRYYRHGLAWAGSKFGFHCIGSTMAIRGAAYYAVRGMPKRQAGEDFYLLNKVAKLGKVVVPEASPLRIAQRDSARTPFGTGPATQSIAKELLRGEGFYVYNPTSFALLREWLDTLDEFARTCDMSVLDKLSKPILRAALPLETEKRLRESRTQCKSETVRRERLHNWFDGFRTLKLIHALRRHGLEDIPWQEAFDSAPFIPFTGTETKLREALAGHSAPIDPK